MPDPHRSVIFDPHHQVAALHLLLLCLCFGASLTAGHPGAAMSQQLHEPMPAAWLNSTRHQQVGGDETFPPMLFASGRGIGGGKQPASSGATAGAAGRVITVAKDSDAVMAGHLPQGVLSGGSKTAARGGAKQKDAFTCKDAAGREVTWFIVLKQRGLFSYVVATSSNPTFSAADNIHESGPVHNTLAQSDEQDSCYDYTSFNALASQGHQNGVLMLGRRKGFWLIHSWRRLFYYFKARQYPNPGRTKGQSFICATHGSAGGTAERTCGKRIGRFPAGRIINGYPAIRGQFPWQVGIRLKVSDTETRQHCGGTIINDRWIVTASHCFEYPKGYYALRVGDLDSEVLESSEREFDIDLLFLHPQYTGQPAYDYDITLIKIQPDSKGYMTFDDAVQPACLPEKDLVTDKKTVCHISGWGSVGDMELSRNLMAANVPLITNERCNSLYPGRITDRMQCAGFEAGGIDSCQGDSGGPLVCPIGPDKVYTLLGATSWGGGCAMPGSPGVYANIRNLRDWIDEIMRSNP